MVWAHSSPRQQTPLQWQGLNTALSAQKKSAEADHSGWFSGHVTKPPLLELKMGIHKWVEEAKACEAVIHVKPKISL